MELNRWYQLIDENWTDEMEEAINDGFWRREWYPDSVYHCRTIEEMIQQSVKRGLFRSGCAAALELYAQGLYMSLAKSVAVVTHIAIGTSRYNARLQNLCEHILRIEK